MKIENFLKKIKKRILQSELIILVKDLIKFNYSFILKHLYVICVITFFITLFFTGLLTYKDYGISWDEPFQREVGKATYAYLFEDNKQIFETFSDSDYGPAFELPLIILEKKLGYIDRFEDSSKIYEMRHLVTFIFSFIGLTAFFFLAKRYISNGWIALLGTIFFVLTPRIYADMFYNTKDIPFMMMYIIAMLAVFNFLKKKSYVNLLFAAFSTGILINLRMLGILMPTIICLLFLLQITNLKLQVDKRVKNIRLLLLYLAVTLIVLIASWPYLWDSPAEKLVLAFESMRKFRWGGSNLYFGEYVPANSLPWHYSLVWISITTPILYIFLFVLGAGNVSIGYIKKFKTFIHDKDFQFDFLIFGTAVGPILAVILFHSVLYDGWRHLYFVYPFILLIALKGLDISTKNIRVKKLFQTNLIFRISVIAIVYLSLANNLYFIVTKHPSHNVYFNEAVRLSGKKMHGEFELDYWGLSYKRGLKYILENDSSKKININQNSLGYFSLLIIPWKDQQRLNYVEDIKQADYYLTTYRWEPNRVVENGDLVYEVRIGKDRILSVYKIWR